VVRAPGYRSRGPGFETPVSRCSSLWHQYISRSMFPNYESVATVVWWSELLVTDPEVPGSKPLFLGVPSFGTNTFQEICFLITKVLPLWSGGQSSWLQIQRSRVRNPCFLVFQPLAPILFKKYVS
jgi:hypothetical protein